ncbi:DUF4192 family protein [Streptomyces sp. SDr-06]|nr:DUF4192 family protein [Streptomyces sp. SDr-06]
MSEHHESEPCNPEPRDCESREAESRGFETTGLGPSDAASCHSEAHEPEAPSSESHGSAGEPRITLRGPAELADALPYLMGFYPTDSVVLVALHGESGRFGGRVRVGLPASPQEWPDISDQLADCLVTGSERRGQRPDGIVVFLCQDPSGGGSGHEVMERLRPLAQRLRTACGVLDVPVLEALCISDGRYWSYCCPDARCCPPEGSVLALPGTSVMAAAATYAGIQVRGSLREMEARFAPWVTEAAAEQERALDAAAAEMFPRILSEGDRRTVADETLDLAARLMRRIAEAPAPTRGPDLVPAGRRGTGTLLVGRNAEDDQDDGLIAHDEAAAVILGLQDRTTRDWAAEWMEGAEAGPALRLWRALARRCVGPYGDHAAALLTLAGWVSWSTGDDPHARVAFSLALRADPDYRFARLLHQACNGGLDPEDLRICLREERAARLAEPAAPKGEQRDGVPAGGTVESPELAAVAEADATVAEGAVEAAAGDAQTSAAGSVAAFAPEGAQAAATEGTHTDATEDVRVTAPRSSDSLVSEDGHAAACEASPGPVEPSAPRAARPKSRRTTPAASPQANANEASRRGSSGSSESSRPEPTRPDPARPDSARSDSTRPNPGRPDSARVDSRRPNSGNGRARVRRRGGEPVERKGS